jgi:CheY-like chemotaxis protein
MLPQPQRPATILIIDDEPIQLRAIVAELNALGFETLIARSGAEGLAKAMSPMPIPARPGEHNPDAAIC